MFTMKLRHIFFIILISHVYILCGANPLIGPTVREAHPNEFDFVVSLSLKKSNSKGDELNHFCGGVLISQQHVLTSAHCKKLAKRVSDVVVKIGSNDLRDSVPYKIENWITFADYKKSHKIKVSFLDDDISVIELKRSVDPRIKAAVIAKFDKSNDLAGEKVVTAGWGSSTNEQYPRYMLTANLKILSYEECICRMNQVDLLDVDHDLNVGAFCTNASPHVVIGCGDSGSPLLINGNEVIGINDSSCPVQGDRFVDLEQNIHLRVDHYDFFIRDVVNNMRTNSSSKPRKTNWLCWRRHK